MLPGRAPETRFGENAQPRMQGSIPEAYAALAQSVFAGWGSRLPSLGRWTWQNRCGVRRTTHRAPFAWLLALTPWRWPSHAEPRVPDLDYAGRLTLIRSMKWEECQ
jgi:hypothetical protein